MLNALCVEEDDLWIGTDGGGICRINTRTLAIERIAYNLPGPDGQALVVRDLLWAHNRLWMATEDRGALSYHPDTKEWHTNGEGVHLKKYTVSISALKEGTVWAGMTGHSSVKLYPDYEGYDPLAKRFQGPFPYPAFTVETVLETANGQVWLGGWDNGLHRWNAD